jgi:hypothetical protein
MKAEIEFLHCGEQLQKVVADEISEIASVVDAVKWSEVFEHSENDTVSQHQTAYNKALARNFRGLGWETFPVLRRDPKLIGDFRKGMVFVEIQFGNSATLYRDFYKFQYGLRNGLLSLAVLIVPMKAAAILPDATGERAQYGGVRVGAVVFHGACDQRPDDAHRAAADGLNRSAAPSTDRRGELGRERRRVEAGGQEKSRSELRNSKREAPRRPLDAMACSFAR